MQQTSQKEFVSEHTFEGTSSEWRNFDRKNCKQWKIYNQDYEDEPKVRVLKIKHFSTIYLA